MKTGLSQNHWLCFLCLAVLALLPCASGCFSNYKNRTNQQIWEREMRLEEDCIYRLRWQLEDKQRELDEANARTGSLNRQTEILRDRGTNGPDLGPPPAFSPSNSGRGNESPQLPPAPQGLPEVQPGKPFTPGASNSPPHHLDGGLSPESELAISEVVQAVYTSSGPAEKSSAHPAPENRSPRSVERLNPDVEVDSIELNEGLTGEVNSTGEAGGGYLNVVIFQRDSHGKRVLAPGDVSIVVVDPALEGPAARVGRWNFEADDIPQHVRRNHDGGSLQFELPWPNPPEHSDLRVFVRFTSFEGRRLEANLPIDVQTGNAESSPRDWKKISASSAARSVTLADAFADAAKALHAATPGSDSHGSVYEANDSAAGPALASQSLPSTNQPPTNQPEKQPLLDASRRPVWSPYR
ncbi:MAG TPA: hypothetical protein VFE46_16970 [Pirellulales bacterium]|jgi:hypothetical protein|nr:hypothetical protein [Pirellulales bacterium]